MDDIQSLDTRVQKGRCRLTLKFTSGRDEQLARASALNAINSVMAHLPPRVLLPTLEIRYPDAPFAINKDKTCRWEASPALSVSNRCPRWNASTASVA
jgi:multidrug efflux pump subunit AcrB